MKDISICKRDGNSKRNFLLVNKNLGKHIPLEPKLLRNELGYKLGKLCYNRLADAHGKEREKIGKVLVIGFAETATALGYYVWEYLKREGVSNIEYITTTRKRLEGYKYLESTESHSHATEQLLNVEGLEFIRRNAGEKQEDKLVTDIVVIDDEITTGNTAKKLLNKVIEYCGEDKIGLCYVASALKSADRILDKLESGKEVTYLALDDIDKDEYTGYSAKMDEVVGNDCDVKAYDNVNSSIEDILCPVRYIKDKCDGVISGGYVEVSQICGGHYDFYTISYIAENILKELRDDIDGMKEIHVIGTEEFMQIPVRVGCLLDETLQGSGCKVYTHSTTRSPIEPSDDYVGDAIRNRLEFNSPYGYYKSYLYNCNSLEDKKSAAVIITDANVRKSSLSVRSLADLCAGLRTYGVDRVILVYMGGD